ncbi:MAG: hypothetical protein ACXVHB_12005 [Solirubrobacteraceae bacterium]
MSGRSNHDVAIVPSSARARYSELLRALEEAYPVTFTGSSPHEIRSAAAVIAFPGERRPDGLRVPCLQLADPGGQPARGSSFTVEMSRCDEVHRALRGQRLLEKDASPPAPLVPDAGDRVLAATAGKPIWVHNETHGEFWETASALPSELEDGEFLRDHFTVERFWSLLPIVHFLKRLSNDPPRTPRRLHACFVIDDPNIRFSSYGYVRFPELGSDAREHGYHVAIATIPLDLVLPGGGAVSVFEGFRSELSLVMHGNDHVHRELERRRGAVAADRMILAALARVRRFEARTGLRVERVMCPPHGGCGPETLAALFRCGFLGIAASRSFPWDGFTGQRQWRLSGWLPAQLAGGGLPVFPRYALSRSLDDLVFRAFLGQPLILYCHHADLRGGLEPFQAAAARAAELGDVRWMSLGSIAATNALCHEQDGVATVRVYSRDLRLPRPAAGIVRVEVPRVFGADQRVRMLVDGEGHDVEAGPDGSGSATFTNVSTSGELRVQIAAPGSAAAATIHDWRPRAWPLVRRAMTETRDRALPLIRDLRS